MKKKKKLIIIIIFIIVVISFAQITYKLLKSGNNINKSDDNNILNIRSYEAIIEVETYSNKNTNKYLISQKYSEPNIMKQEILEPEGLKGIKTVFDGEKLILENKKLNLKKIYEKYKILQGNSLSLIRFVQELQNNTKPEIEEDNQEEIIKIKLNDSKNKYEMYKKLYINKNTKLPSKMEILDINQNRTVYILYKEIKINKMSKEEILEN